MGGLCLEYHQRQCRWHDTSHASLHTSVGQGPRKPPRGLHFDIGTRARWPRLAGQRLSHKLGDLNSRDGRPGPRGCSYIWFSSSDFAIERPSFCNGFIRISPTNEGLASSPAWTACPRLIAPGDRGNRRAGCAEEAGLHWRRGYSQISKRIRAGFSTASLMRRRNNTASLPSKIR